MVRGFSSWRILVTWGRNVSNTKLLLQKLRDIRVLRSSCSESLEGEFRVHLPEREWDEIQGLVRELMELPVSQT
jgi:hypothetical protein